MTTYGTGFASISTSITGSPSDPSGDILQLWCQRIRFGDNFRIKQSYTYGGQSFTPVKGKVVRKVTLSRCVIYDDDGNQETNTAAINNRMSFLRQPQKIDGTQVYLIIESDIDSVNIDLSEDKDGSLDYMKGYILRFDVTPVGAHYEMDLIFVESSLL